MGDKLSWLFMGKVSIIKPQISKIFFEQTRYEQNVISSNKY